MSNFAITAINENVDGINTKHGQWNHENVTKIKKNKRKDLTEEEKIEIANYLLLNIHDGKIRHGAINDAASKFGLHRNIISLIWAKMKPKIGEGVTNFDFSSRKRASGRKPKNWGKVLEKMKKIPFNKRSTLRSLSFATNIPVSTLHLLLHKQKIKRISSTVKPLITKKNEEQRLKFAVSFVKSDGQFHDMFDYIHIDEKWFYMTKVKRNYYLVADEEPPERSVKSKKFIQKVMFMTAVARPCWDHDSQTFFDGKIGIWPFVIYEAAKRNSKNRLKGTIVTKPVASVDKGAVKEMIIKNVLPSIKRNMPLSRKKQVLYIQQDNAKPHAYTNDPSLDNECKKGGWNIVMKNQPPNSPDFNVLDLGFFNSIQSLQHQETPNSIDELINCVIQAYNKFGHDKLEKVFLSYQCALESTMKVGGSNKYKLQHIHKDKMKNIGSKCDNVICDPLTYSQAVEKLNEIEKKQAS